MTLTFRGLTDAIKSSSGYNSSESLEIWTIRLYRAATILTNFPYVTKEEITKRFGDVLLLLANISAKTGVEPNVYWGADREKGNPSESYLRTRLAPKDLMDALINIGEVVVEASNCPESFSEIVFSSYVESCLCPLILMAETEAIDLSAIAQTCILIANDVPLQEAPKNPSCQFALMEHWGENQEFSALKGNSPNLGNAVEEFKRIGADEKYSPKGDRTLKLIALRGEFFHEGEQSIKPPTTIAIFSTQRVAVDDDDWSESLTRYVDTAMLSMMMMGGG